MYSETRAHYLCNDLTDKPTKVRSKQLLLRSNTGNGMQRCLFNNSANTFARRQNGTTAVKIDVFLARWHHHARPANEGHGESEDVLDGLAEF